jgi:hypothetical protein
VTAAAAAWRQRGGQHSGIATAVAALLQTASSLAAGAAAWRQRGVSGGSTINNQLKALAAMVTVL